MGLVELSERPAEVQNGVERKSIYLQTIRIELGGNAVMAASDPEVVLAETSRAVEAVEDAAVEGDPAALTSVQRTAGEAAVSTVVATEEPATLGRRPLPFLEPPSASEAACRHTLDLAAQYKWPEVSPGPARYY